ncbi:MAG: hypothetical protein L0H63_10365 [Nitrococcus sp.]|nr:hypothetical protein [Nitrococcus sp.]
MVFVEQRRNSFTVARTMKASRRMPGSASRPAIAVCRLSTFRLKIGGEWIGSQQQRDTGLQQASRVFSPSIGAGYSAPCIRYLRISFAYPTPADKLLKLAGLLSHAGRADMYSSFRSHFARMDIMALGKLPWRIKLQSTNAFTEKATFIIIGG